MIYDRGRRGFFFFFIFLGFEIRLHAEFQLPILLRSGSFMVGDKKEKEKKKKKKMGVPNQPSLNRVKTNNSTSKQHRKLKFGVQYIST